MVFEHPPRKLTALLVVAVAAFSVAPAVAPTVIESPAAAHAAQNGVTAMVDLGTERR